MTVEDAILLHSEPGCTIARDIMLVVPGADPLRAASAGAGDTRPQVTKYLLIHTAGIVTFTTLVGAGRTYETTSGMAFPVRLDVFATHVTASTATVYAAF